MQLVLIKKFESTKELPITLPKEGRLYRAIRETVGWNIIMEDGSQLIVQNNDIFKFDLLEVTEANKNKIKVHPDDTALLKTFFELGRVAQQPPSTSFEELKIIDSVMYDALNQLISYIVSTYKDKYEEPQPMIDNTWLKYGPGKIPVGHNVGQAAAYLKRYCSEGFEKSYNPDDLKKAIHFLLFEFGRRTHS